MGMWSQNPIAKVVATSLLSLCAVVSLADSQPAFALKSGSWSWPLAGAQTVIKNYQAPAHHYSAGHRGIDLPAELGTAVFAPADGVVRFAGTVVDREVFSLDHGTYISTYEPLHTHLNPGETVRRGEMIGTVSAGPHCTCLHMGAKNGEYYLSPLALLGAIAPAVLLPWD